MKMWAGPKWWNIVFHWWRVSNQSGNLLTDWDLRKKAEANRQVQELLEKSLIEPANEAWSSPVVMVRKKNGEWRFCIDYRRLNAITQQDAYAIPRIDESRYFSTLDLTSGCWQVLLDLDAQKKSAFATRNGL